MPKKDFTNEAREFIMSTKVSPSETTILKVFLEIARSMHTEEKFVGLVAAAMEKAYYDGRKSAKPQKTDN